MAGQEKREHEKTVGLREILAVLRKRFIIIVAITLCSVFVSGIVSFFLLTPVYEARTLILATQATTIDRYRHETSEGLEGIMSNIFRPPEMTVNTYVGQFTSTAVLEGTIRELGLGEKGYTVDKLARDIQVTALKETNLIELRVTNTDPIMATEIANTMALEFLWFISRANEIQMERAIVFLEEQEDSISEKLKENRYELTQNEIEHFEWSINLLKTKKAELQILKSMNLGETSLRIVSPAIMPEVPIKPNITFNIIITLLFSLMASMAVAFLADFLDNTIKTPEQVVELFDLPVVGQIPDLRQERQIFRGVDHGR